jgi:hypothetical protein
VKLDPDEMDVMGPGWEEHRETRRFQAERWEVRAAEWKVLELARHVFGPGASVRLARYPGRGSFRGLLRLEVPFLDLEDHGRREACFLALVRGEAVLEQVPLIFIFDPAPHSGVLPVVEAAASPGPETLPRGYREDGA